VLEGTEVLEEATENLQLQLIEEQSSWWNHAQVQLGERLEAFDKRMEANYAQQVAGGKLVFDLQPGQSVLVREYQPGKMRLKAVGPYRFLRKLQGNGAEVLNRKGRILKVAMSNLKPYHAPVLGERAVVTQPAKGRSPDMFDSSSEDEWSSAVTESDED
jgi:hypothetical protein